MLTEVIEIVSKLGKIYHSPLRQLVLDAWDLLQLTRLASSSPQLCCNIINSIDAPSKALNESVQLRRTILKQFLLEITPNLCNDNAHQVSRRLLKGNTIKFIQIDNVIVSIRNILHVIKNKKNVQIVVTDSKLKKLIKTYLRIIAKCNKEIIDNTIAKMIDSIMPASFVYEDCLISVIDIDDMKYKCDVTIFFDVSPDVTWASNIGRLWLSGRDRELLGLTTRVNWHKMLHISYETYVFCRERDLPQWQRIHTCCVDKIKVNFPVLKLNPSNDTTKISDLIPELIVKNDAISDLLYNQYIFYIKNILQLKPKKTVVEKDTRIFDIFNELKKNKLSKPELELLWSELKNTDYFYYKKLQSFFEKIPRWEYSSHSINIDSLTVVYNSNPYMQSLNTTEVDYYNLTNSISAKDVISGIKTSLMTQAIQTNTDNIKFNIISPDWHSNVGINKRTIEMSKESVNKYRETIVSAWKSFLQAEVKDLKLDMNKTSQYYRYFERIK